MTPNVRRYAYSRLCENFDSPRVYPIYDSHQSFVEVARFATEESAQRWCDRENTRAVEQALTGKPSSEEKTTPAYVATPLIATAETDAALKDEYGCKGADAFREGIKIEDCPFDGMLKGWWKQGWQRAQSMAGGVPSWPL